MIKMPRSEFYLLIYILIIGTAAFVGLPEYPLTWLCVIVGGVLFGHYKHTSKALTKELYRDTDLKQ